MKWTHVQIALPTHGNPVETMIDDRAGVRNLATLRYSSGIWWLPNATVSIAYTPTHWREIQLPSKK